MAREEKTENSLELDFNFLYKYTSWIVKQFQCSKFYFDKYAAIVHMELLGDLFACCERKLGVSCVKKGVTLFSHTIRKC